MRKPKCGTPAPYFDVMNSLHAGSDATSHRNYNQASTNIQTNTQTHKVKYKQLAGQIIVFYNQASTNIHTNTQHTQGQIQTTCWTNHRIL